MVAGWDQLLPAWFSRLHPGYKTPINSIIFVGTLTLVIAISSQVGTGIHEAFQLVDNAANVFYGIVLTVYPIIDVPSPLIFAAKIVAVTAIANAVGGAIFWLGERRRHAALR